MLVNELVAVTDLAPTGTVLMDGEEWRAETGLSWPIRAGDEVLVEGEYGDMLKVAPLSSLPLPRARRRVNLRRFLKG